jgi:hypothetical protein
MPLAVFESTIQAIEWSHNYSLDGTTTGVGKDW